MSLNICKEYNQEGSNDLVLKCIQVTTAITETPLLTSFLNEENYNNNNFSFLPDQIREIVSKVKDNLNQCVLERLRSHYIKNGKDPVDFNNIYYCVTIGGEFKVEESLRVFFTGFVNDFCSLDYIDNYYKNHVEKLILDTGKYMLVRSIWPYITTIMELDNYIKENKDRMIKNCIVSPTIENITQAVKLWTVIIQISIIYKEMVAKTQSLQKG